MKRTSCVLLPLLLASAIVYAATAPSFVVNGKPVKTELVNVKGRYYVSVSDMAAALGADLVTEKGVICLNTPKADKPDAKPAAVATKPTGTVKGVVMYLKNAYDMYQPDVGARVWVLRGFMYPSEDEEVDGDEKGLVCLGKTRKAIAYAVVDANGKYQLDNIPPGEYTIIIQSRHKVGDNTRDSLGKMASIYRRNIDAGVTDVSWDF